MIFEWHEIYTFISMLSEGMYCKIEKKLLLTHSNVFLMDLWMCLIDMWMCKLFTFYLRMCLMNLILFEGSLSQHMNGGKVGLRNLGNTVSRILKSLFIIYQKFYNVDMPFFQKVK